MGSSVKILFNAVSAKSGGAAVSMENLCRSLASRKSRHEFIFLVPPKLAACVGRLGAHIEVIPSEIGLGPPWKRFFWDQVTLRRIAKEQRVDVLVSTSDFGMLFPPCPQILMVSNSVFFSPFYVKRILPLKSAKFKLEFLLRRWLISLSVKAADVVIASSESMVMLLREYIPHLDKKLVVNYLGVPLKLFLRRAPPSKKGADKVTKPFQLLFVSEYSDYKNLTILLKTVLLLRQQGVDDFRLMTTADPWQFPDVEIVSREEDKRLATHPMIAAVVKFTGIVPYADVPTLYAQSDLFIFPSLTESFAYPLVEAMASGLPVIAADIPICREICGEAAVYFNPLNADDLAQKIRNMRDDPKRRRELGALGRKRAIQQFDWNDHVKRLLELIEKTSKEKKALR
jgi:glycosyltransferase involved in cell wall biosynthesis